MRSTRRWPTEPTARARRGVDDDLAESDHAGSGQASEPAGAPPAKWYQSLADGLNTLRGVPSATTDGVADEELEAGYSQFDDDDDGDDDGDVATGERPTGWRAFLAPPNENYVKPKDRPRPWWGMGDMVVWFLVAQVAAAIVYFLVLSIGGYSAYWPGGQGAVAGEVMGRIGSGQAPYVTKSLADVPLWVERGVFELPLWVGFLGGPLYAVWRKGTSLKEDFGLSMKWIDVPFGLAIGAFAQLVVVWAIYKLLFLFTGDQDVSATARAITDRATSPWAVAFIVVVVGFGSPIFEELFFRGLSQRSIINRCGPNLGLILSAAFFAIVHGNLLLFPALFAFGLILGWLAHHYGRLGPSMWAHIGFNMVTVIALVGNFNLP